MTLKLFSSLSMNLSKYYPFGRPLFPKIRLARTDQWTMIGRDTGWEKPLIIGGIIILMGHGLSENTTVLNWRVRFCVVLPSKGRARFSRWMQIRFWNGIQLDSYLLLGILSDVFCKCTCSFLKNYLEMEHYFVTFEIFDTLALLGFSTPDT